MSIFLDGVAVRFYRGIGPEVQYIAPFARINFFIGANNAGKSIVLNLLAQQLPAVKKNTKCTLIDSTDQYKGERTGNFALAIGTKPESLHARIMNSKNSQRFSETRSHGLQPFSQDLLVICKKLTTHDLVWQVLTDDHDESIVGKIDSNVAQRWSQSWGNIWQIFKNYTGGGISTWVDETIDVLRKNAVPPLPSAHLIPAKRQLGPKNESFKDLSGRGVIDHLATLQNPAWDRQEEREKFQRINRFLREVTGKPDATLEVPSEREHLLVHMDKKVLPLSSLGTGIHEVVLIAAFCTIHDKTIMCIEEPEIHLHPILQRKLMTYLLENTESQYFVATHSSAFIDTPGANIFHVTSDGIQTFVRPAVTKKGQRNLLDDLGYQASDLFQTNVAVWVEGPSDRLYLNHWIKSFDPSLKEGTHYTIIFYGGALISHLSTSDGAVDDFIKLRDLNRHMAIVLDSDRDHPDATLKTHAQRILVEMGQNTGIVWITDGREVENYLDPVQLQRALKILHPKIYKEAGKTGQYDHAFYFMRTPTKNGGRKETFKEGDKVGAARILCEQPAELDRLDLRERVRDLTTLIREANGMEVPD